MSIQANGGSWLQRALAGDADVQAHASALDALTRRCPADLPDGQAAALDGTRR